MSKEVKLTNWQVPNNPATERFRAFANLPQIDMKRYENVGSVEHHDSVESVAAKMIAKQEAARGMRIDQEPVKQTVNLGGIVDDRPNKVFFKTKGFK